VALIHGVTSDGRGLNVLRLRDNKLEAGAVRPLEHGKPLAGEVVRLHPRPELPVLCDVEVQLRVPDAGADQSMHDAESAPSRERKGPAQVASNSYRHNWDIIWARKPNTDAPN
jgi:hypothetical protein